MFKWKKLGRVFNPTETYNKPWMKEFAQCTSTLVFDDFVRVYFSCRPQRDENGLYVSYTSFIDLDRKDLFKIVNLAEKPILDLGELGTFDEFGIYPTSTIRIGKQVFLYYAGWTRNTSVFANVAIGLAISNDNGVTFQRFAKGPILSRSANDPFVVSGPKVRKFNDKWYLYYLAGEKWIMSKGNSEVIYKIKMATSDDGIEWKRINRNIIDFSLEVNECQAGPDVFFYDGKYHMFFSYRYGLDFRNNDRGYRIGYAHSNDLFNWVRNDDNAGITLSEHGWDSGMMLYPHIFELDGKVYMFYNGNKFGKYGFGIAILEK